MSNAQWQPILWNVFLVLCLAWLEHCPGSLETTAHQHAHLVDGWKLHLSLPHHDGGDDVGEASSDSLQLQRRYDTS